MSDEVVDVVGIDKESGRKPVGMMTPRMEAAKLRRLKELVKNIIIAHSMGR